MTILKFPESDAFPESVDRSKVGEYSAQAKSGGGFFYDEVLEYRVWVHPEAGGAPLHDEEDYFFAFPTYSEAAAFAASTPGAEQPLVLVRQLEHVNEPEPGVYEHVIGERIAEWQVPWLHGGKRQESTIREFLKRSRRDG
jgi:putative acetyltransferase